MRTLVYYMKAKHICWLLIFLISLTQKLWV